MPIINARGYSITATKKNRLVPDTDLAHIDRDIKRLYGHLAAERKTCVEHLKASYSFLFSLVVSTNPFLNRPSPAVIG